MKIYPVLICIICLSLLCGFGNALMQYQSDSALILTSDQIVYGKVIDVHSAWNAQKTHIETTAEILVADAFKQSDMSNISSGTTVQVTVLGGTVGDVTEWVEDMPVFVPGTDAFVFLNERSDGKYSVNGLHQGLHIVNNNKKGQSTSTKSSSSANEVEKFKERINKTLQGKPTDIVPMDIFSSSSDTVDATDPVVYSVVVTTVSPDTASAGTDSVITITGSGFGTKANRTSYADVAFLYRTNGGADTYIWATGWPYLDNADDIVSWTDTRIEVKVPTGITSDGYSGSASSGCLYVCPDAGDCSAAIPFTVTFGYGKNKWNTPVTYSVNPGTVSGSALAVQNAATTWNNAIPGSKFRFNYGGLTTCSTLGKDGTNLIYFGPASDFSSNPSVIAWATWWSSSGIITETDIEFNTNWTWTTGTASGSTMNVEAITLHELGHWLSLRDLYGCLPQYWPQNYTGWPSDISPEMKVMFGYNGDSIGNKNLKTLSSAEVAGIRWIYPTPIITNITPSSGYNSGSVSITNLTGTNFANGATVNLTRNGYANISATGVAVPSATMITCTLNITGREPGQWTVVVTNPDNQFGILNNGFTILTALPDAVFNATPIVGVAPLTVIFTDQSTGTPDSWNWTFGDGDATNATDRNPVHTYLAPGSYNVTLNVTNPYGFDTVIRTGYVRVSNITVDKIGVIRNSHDWYLDFNGNGTWDGAVMDKQYALGKAGDMPVVGDWNGNGITEIGVFRDNHTWNVDYNGNGVWEGIPGGDRIYITGKPGDVPVPGDWNGDNITEMAVFRGNHTWYIDYNGNGIWDSPAGGDRIYITGKPGDIPVPCDWNGDGTTEMSVFRGNHTWYIDYNGNGIWDSPAGGDRIYTTGQPGDLPVYGDWNGDRLCEMGVFRPSNHNFYLDFNANGLWDGASVDKRYDFGAYGDIPVSGKW